MKKFLAMAAILTFASFAVFAQNNVEPLEEASEAVETAEEEVSKTDKTASAPLLRWSASAAGLLSLQGFSEAEKYTDAYGGEHQGRLGSGGLYSMPWFYIGGLGGQERRIFNLGATITNEERTLGALLSIQTSIPHQSGVNFAGLGYVWWKPVEQFKMQIGYSSPAKGDPSVDISLVNSGVIPVRDYGSAINSIAGGEHTSWNPQRVHHGYGRESVMAATFEFFPIENLYITTSTPFEPLWNGARGGEAPISEVNALDILAQTAAQVAYTIPDVGIVALTWDGGTMQVDQYSLMERWQPGNGGGLFFDDPAFLTLGFNFDRFYDEEKDEGVVVYLGVDVPLPSTRWRSMFVKTAPESKDLPEKKEWRAGEDNHDEITVQRPYGIDLRADFTTGDFQIVGGFAVNFGGYTAYQPEGQLRGRANMPLTFGVTVNPQFDLGFMNVGFVAEYKFHAEQKNVADPYHMFNIAPYIQKSIGHGTLWAAVTIEGLALDDSDELDPQKNGGIIPWKQGLRWAIPVGLRFSL
jgi:hypothetical protein